MAGSFAEEVRAKTRAEKPQSSANKQAVRGRTHRFKARSRFKIRLAGEGIAHHMRR